MNTRKLRIEGDGFFELFNRFREKTGFAIRAADEHTQRRTIAETIGHTLVELSRLSDVLTFQKTEPECVLGIVVARRQFQCLFELASGLFKLTHHEPRFAEHVMRCRILWLGGDDTL